MVLLIKKPERIFQDKKVVSRKKKKENGNIKKENILIWGTVSKR